MLRRLFGRGPVEHRDAYTNTAVDALVTAALTGSVDPQTTAAVETAVRALCGPYGVATVTGPSMITPSFLMDLARRLFTTGNAVYRLGDELQLIPAATFDVGGTVGRWIYELETPIPGNGKVDRRKVPQDGVVHVKINAPAGEPWRGRAPWQIASATAKTLAGIERSLGYDAAPRGGYILPLPDGVAVNAATQVKSALTAGVGGVNLVETTAQGFGAGLTAAPKEDYVQKRYGSVVPEPNIVLRDKSAEAILEAYGIPPAMFTGDGNSLREGRRILFYDTILPTSALIAEELSRKLETPVTISHNDSEFSDSQRLGRYLKALVDAGYSLPDAATIVGLPKVE